LGKGDERALWLATLISVRQLTKRAVVPTAALWLLESKASDVVRANLGRLRRRKPRAELYVAFDDPHSLLGLDLARELAQEHGIEVQIFPVVRRGIVRDPLDDVRRRYSVVDAGRLARRLGRDFSRTEPIEAERVAELAAWIELARASAKHEELAAALFERLWAGPQALPDFGELFAIFRRIVGETPRRDLMLHRFQLRRNERLMQRRGLWETPSLWLEGKGYFAHERREQVLAHARELSS